MPTPSDRTDSTVRIPKGFVFPVNPKGPVRIKGTTIDGEPIEMDIGGVSELGGGGKDVSPCVCFRHQRIILNILFGRPFDNPELPVLYKDLLQRDANGNSAKSLRRTLVELSRVRAHVIRPGRQIISVPFFQFNADVYYRDGVDVNDPAQREIESNIALRRLRNVTFNEYFWRLAVNWANCWDVRADVVHDINSDVAAATYMKLLPACYAGGYTSSDRGYRLVGPLLEELGCPVPRFPSDIARAYERTRGHQPSPLAQIDGRPTWEGHLRVSHKLVPVKGGLAIEFWEEKNILPERDAPFAGENGKTFTAWTAAGLDPAAFLALRRSTSRTLTEHEVERIGELGYPVEPNLAYLELARAMLGPTEFGAAISEAHHLVRTRSDIGSRAHFFGGILRNYMHEDIAKRSARKQGR